jgi:hypothetical protein
MMQTAEFNPRYVSYARAHGRSPEDQSAHDRAEYPGAQMTGFIIWISGEKEAFRVAHPECFLGRDTIQDGAAWDEWLRARAAESSH